jgi:hypothetical protein
VFLHVRCIPHQNSQRCFWASVWFMLDSSRWHEPFGESLSKLRLDTLKWPQNWLDTFESVIRLSKVKQPFTLSVPWSKKQNYTKTQPNINTYSLPNGLSTLTPCLGF